jgi:dTDP-4-dehydrorhamnose 3,5-epimerase
MIASAVKDGPQVTSDWQKVQPAIDGVVAHEVLHVPRDHGVITEMYRPEWDPSGLPLVQCYQSRLFPGAIGAWSCHAKTIDRLFVNQGCLKVVLYDGREESPTYRRLMEMYVGDARPTFVVIPIGVWHGLQNVGGVDALMVNFPSRAYDYADPDHYRLPWDSEEIPYRWPVTSNARLRSDTGRSKPLS